MPRRSELLARLGAAFSPEYDVRASARLMTPLDLLPLLGFIAFSCILIAATPPTSKWKRVRASVFPVMLSYQVWVILATVDTPWHRCWGSITGQIWHTVKALEVMVLYPAEEYCYRVRSASSGFGRPVKPVEGDGGVVGTGSETEVDEADQVNLVSEPVPPPLTLAKLYWAFNLWFSQRGIGWNYAAPLPASSKHHPFVRGSSRRAYLLNRGIYFICVYLVCDLSRAYMAFGPGAAFFAGRPGIAPPYDSLTLLERALYSLPLAASVLWSIEEYYLPISLLMVCVGGITGWEGEWWEPWGWPPLFGTIKDLWVHPGLSHMWSKTWHQYFHHWLYLFGWLGIGETILGLPHSGISARPRPAVERRPTVNSMNAGPPVDSQTTTHSASPAHPIPSTPPSRGKQSPSPHLLLANFTKSLIVFALTGLYHDLPGYVVLLHTASPGQPIRWSDCFPTSLFFVLQPFALAIEALTKRAWRGWKDGAYPQWQKGRAEPGWVITVERAVGFVWTWWWLGHTARYFVVGLTRAGLFVRREGQPVSFSPLGGLLYGEWYH